jgi:putative transposase
MLSRSLSRHRSCVARTVQSIPIEEDEHLRVVLPYIERNPLRASLVERAEQWPWSSLCPGGEKPLLDPGPAPRSAGWVQAVNAAMTEAKGESIRTSIRRNCPLGTQAWVQQTAEKLGLESSLRAPGRPAGRTDMGEKDPRSPKR